MRFVFVVFNIVMKEGRNGMTYKSTNSQCDNTKITFSSVRNGGHVAISWCY